MEGYGKDWRQGGGAQAEVTMLLTDGAVGRSGSGASISIDDCNFHSCAQPDRLAEERVLVATPPRGESVLMNHRAFSIEALPFRVYPFVDETSTTKTVATVKVHADIPPERHAVNVAVLVHVPRWCASCFSESTAGTAVYNTTEHSVVCTLPRIQGGTDFAIRISMTHDKLRPQAKREVGPVELAFQKPAWTPTGVGIRGVSIAENGESMKAYRWICTMTLANSHVRRVVWCHNFKCRNQQNNT